MEREKIFYSLKQMSLVWMHSDYMYSSFDIMEGAADYAVDMTDLSFEDEKFDCIFSNHSGTTTIIKKGESVTK